MAEEDIISNLPDCLLCHILSFLETKHAVATTVLSKRWNNLCFSVPVLHFNTTITDQNTYLRFINFVYSVLLSRNLVFPIKTLFLVFSYDDIDNQIVHPHSPMETITKWINFVVQRGVENLDLYIELGEVVGFTKLPISILTCNTLVVLNLHCFSLEEVFSPVLLPSLKTLRFNNMWFSKLRDFMLFLNGCPILEDLFTFNVLFDSEESLTRDEWKSFRLSNLTRASNIDCFHSYFPLKAVHNVHSLRLQINQEHYSNDLIPTFHNLTYLELVSLDYGWQFLIKILNHCPKLQELNIDQAPLNKKTWTKKDDKENWVDPDAVPQCLSLNLTTCTLFNFLGLLGEVKLAKYILKNARVLQTMDIVNVGQAKVKRLISSCPRASATCKLRVYVPLEE